MHLQSYEYTQEYDTPTYRIYCLRKSPSSPLGQPTDTPSCYHVCNMVNTPTNTPTNTPLTAVLLCLHKRGRPPPGGGEGGASSNTTRAVGACIGGENWGVLSESCPYTKAKAPLRKVGRTPTGTAALPANQMESGPASV